MQVIDLICTIYFFIELAIQLLGRGLKSYLKKIINKIDTLVIISQFGLMVYMYVISESYIHTQDQYINLIKSLKIIRLLKVLYTAKIFYTLSILTRCVITTVMKMHKMFLLWLFLTLLIA